jgi:glycosyltransferase involved in cell wall biosynthesis
VLGAMRARGGGQAPRASGMTHALPASGGTRAYLAPRVGGPTMRAGRCGGGGRVAEDGAEIAVVVPLFRQPALFVEAVGSVLRQVSAPGFRIVAVLDGCPYRQSLEAATALARAHAPRIAVLRQPNRGLPAARNAGLRFALQAWPECRAVHFLDADNRMGPHLLRRSWDALAAAGPGAGWAYGDFDLFGVRGAWSTAGAHSALQHLTENVCDAAVLVRREVFEAGVAFDERLRGGFEDWDFFLSAIGAGFRGVHVPEAGLAYRRRPESLLRAARREGPALAARLTRAHAALFAPRAILAREAAEAPRLLLADAASGVLCLDPDAPGEAVSRAALLARIAEGLARPGQAHAPAVLGFGAGAAWSALRRAGVLRGVVAAAERLLATVPAVSVTIAPGTGLALRPAAPEPAAPLLLLRGAALADAAQRVPARGLAVTLPVGGRPGAASADRPPAARVTAEDAPAPASEGDAAPPAERVALSFAPAAAIAEAWAADLPEALAALPPAPWRRDGRGARSGAAGRAARMAGAHPLLPLAPDPARRDIGFVLPRFGLGGVERAVAGIAAALRGLGWRTHLLVSGAETMAAPPPGAFDSLLLLPGADAERHAGGSAAHAGSPVPVLPEEGEAAEALLGLLAPMHAVLTTHAFAGLGLAARLRRLGVVTAVGLHVTERGAFGEPMGNPQIALGHEHALDLFVCHSARLARWCAAAGVPEEKLLRVVNAPGHATDGARIAAALAARGVAREGPLRALVLGRLDRQKGPDRLPALIAATAGAVAWRIVGRGELDAAPALPVPIEPPVSEPAAIDALYAAADVLVLPSRFEGVPLTVPEAQRMGCVPVAVAVGALDEAVADGVDGVLVPDGDDASVVAGLAAALRGLAADRARLTRLSAAAAERGAALGWEAAAVAIAARLVATASPGQ